MWTRRAFAGLVALSAAGAQATASAQPSDTNGRRAEAEALKRFAETTHPRGREAIADAEWRARWEALARDATTLSDGAYVLRLRRALGWFKDGHATILPFAFTGGVPAPLANGPFSLALPMRVRVFHDGAYVTEAKDEAAPLNGLRITRIGALDDVALMREWTRQFPGNDAWAHRWGADAFDPALLQALGATQDAAAPIVVEATNGRRRVRATLRPRAGAGEGRREIARTKTERETWAAEAGKENYARVLADRRVLYISLDDLGVEIGPFGEFTHDCFAKMEDTRAERLILDLRRNGGGNNYLAEALRKQIARSRFNKPGGFYVLISPVTFSAAQNVTTRIDRETFAIFVGEPSGGKPNHYGDAGVFHGEATGLTAIVSSLPWFDSYPQDEREWVAPDIAAPALFTDWRDGRDAALAAALSHTTNDAPDEWSREAVFYFGRPSQAVPWRPFWRGA